MKKRVVRFFIIACIIVGLISVVYACVAEPRMDLEKEISTDYKCDVKVLALSTKIEIDKEGEEFAKVKGNIFKYVTDPLTMYDMSGNKVAYAGDDYHFIAQDSHLIFVDGAFICEMVGLVDWFGESYDIYDKEQNKIANVTFNYFNTSGQMYDTGGTLIAEYRSKYFFNDFYIRISEKCNLDEKTVLMIFCSYYSDQLYDASNK